MIAPVPAAWSLAEARAYRPTGRAARIAVVAGQHQRARSGLLQPAGATELGNNAGLLGHTGQHLQLGMVGIDDDRIGDADPVAIVDHRAQAL